MREVLAESRRLYGDRHVSVAEALLALGVLRPDQCEELLTQALELWRELVGPRAPSTAKALGRLSQCYGFHERFVEAEGAIREALDIQRETIGEHSTRVGISLNLLSNYLMLQGRAEEALPVSREVVSILRESVGQDHRYMGFALGQLSDTLLALGRDEEAEEALRQALEAYEHIPEDHPWVAEYRYRLAAMLVDHGKRQEASELVDRLLASTKVEPFYGQAKALQSRLLETEPQ